MVGPSSSLSSRSSKGGGGLLLHRFVAVIVVAALSIGWFRIVLLEQQQESGATSAVHMHLEGFANRKKGPAQQKYPTLQCAAYGGPSHAAATQEMVYWQDIPSDAQFISPFHQKQRPQYMTFEPDGGGWNNIRMAMETVLGLALAMGRTLVLPPAQRMYLLGQGHGTGIKTAFSFMDFFPMPELAREHVGLHIITTREFLETVAMTGQLRDVHTGRVSFPPDNRTDWDGADGPSLTRLKEWMRNVTHTPLWSPSHCLAVFPASGKHADALQLQSMLQKIQETPMRVQQHLDAPLPVDAPTMVRLRESLTGRPQLCLYDEAMQQEPVLHFMCSHKLGVRMLVHFYAFLFFENWQEDLWMKRFMRDHMRYIDELQCAAARIVQAIRQHVRQRNTTTDQFDTFHIRRGDFQYKQTRIEAAEIYENVRDILTEGATVYIATDERNKAFFDPLREHYDVLFMDDFKHLLEGVNTNHYGMIDQLVASRGRIFFGCWHSTFTGFINRMRGYHSVREKLPGHEDGLLPNSYYYVPTGQKYVLHKYSPLYGAFFNREFPTSWRQIDQGIGFLSAND